MCVLLLVNVSITNMKMLIFVYVVENMCYFLNIQMLIMGLCAYYNMKMFVNETLWCENFATTLGSHFFFKIGISFLVFKNGYMHYVF